MGVGGMTIASGLDQKAPAASGLNREHDIVASRALEETRVLLVVDVATSVSPNQMVRLVRILTAWTGSPAARH